MTSKDLPMLFRLHRNILPLLTLMFFFRVLPAFGAWTNPGFENGNLTGWTNNVSFGSGSIGGCEPGVTVVGPGPAIDTVVGELNDVHAGNFSAEVFSGDGDANHQDWAQISQADTVPPVTSTISFWLAAIFEDYHYYTYTHGGGGSLTDDVECQISVLVGGSTVNSFILNWPNNVGQIQISSLTSQTGNLASCASSPATQWGYLPWTNFTINMSGYVGQQATLQVTMFDCVGRGHYGVAYVDDVAWTGNTTSQVALTKANSPSGFSASVQPITYTLSYSNPGSAVAGVEFNDTIPTGTTLIANSITSNPAVPVVSQVGSDIIWNLGYLAGGATGTLSFQVQPDPCISSVTNAASETDASLGNVTSNTVSNTFPTCSPTNTPTMTNTPTITATPTYTGTPTNTFTPTSTGTPTFTPTPTCVTYVWPDPYNPKNAYGGTLKISCMDTNSKVSIYTVSGELVQSLDWSNAEQFAGMWGYSYVWDGRNKQKKSVATGIYLFVVQEGSRTVQTGKFLLVDGS